MASWLLVGEDAIASILSSEISRCNSDSLVMLQCFYPQISIPPGRATQSCIQNYIKHTNNPDIQYIWSNLRQDSIPTQSPFLAKERQWVAVSLFSAQSSKLGMAALSRLSRGVGLRALECRLPLPPFAPSYLPSHPAYLPSQPAICYYRGRI